MLGGFILAGYCFYLFRETPTDLPGLGNWRVSVYYAIASVVCIGLAALCWPWGIVFFWPAIAMKIVASGHIRRGPGIFRKANGHLPLSAQFVLGPVLLGQQLSLLYYQRQCKAWDDVLLGVLIGRKLNDSEAEEAVRSGVTAVLDLTSEFSEAKPFLATHYLNIPILDLTAPTQEQLHQMADFITTTCESGKVYVHCKVGYSRSTGAVGAYLIASGKAAGAQDAIAMLRRARPAIIVRPEIVQALQTFENAKFTSAVPA